MHLSSRSAIDVEYPGDSYCLLQDVVERSRQKSDMLQGYGDTVLRAEAMEEQLVKARKHSAMLQSKLDGAFAQYQKKSRTCRRRATSWCERTSHSATRIKVQYCLVEYPLEISCSGLTSPC
jgi:hypothetical protein